MRYAGALGKLSLAEHRTPTQSPEQHRDVHRRSLRYAAISWIDATRIVDNDPVCGSNVDKAANSGTTLILGSARSETVVSTDQWVFRSVVD